MSTWLGREKNAYFMHIPTTTYSCIVSHRMIVFLQRPIDRDTEQYQEKCMQDVRNFPHIFVRVRVRSGTLMKWFNELKRYLAQADPRAVTHYMIILCVRLGRKTHWQFSAHP